MGNRTGVVVAVVLLVGGVLALLVYSTMGLSQMTGEICITYRGRTECRVASGANEQEAIATATQMACTMLSSGMTDRINCQDTEPSRITWMDR